MPEPNEALSVLHACEYSLDQLARRREELPGKVAGLEARAQGARDLIAQGREELEAGEKLRRDKEAELQDCEAQRSKFQGQTAQVKTNTEYTALLHEIDHAGERISSIEEEILVAMERIDDLSAALEIGEREQGKEAKDLDGQAKQLAEELKQVQVDAETRSAELGGLVEGLDAQTRLLFERVRKARGTGTTKVVGRVCASCHRDVPFEDINRVIGGEILPCQSCRRLLVIDPEA
ncbi:MAG: hypothetical protein JRG76_00030 [Deltaproteobacteria bacterium]|nr:hypothetical protein [Deltaproteobacteria bacterium]MBW2412866.1 hypothetical protein [Deltaproteobacteria bacterium]